MVRAKICCIQSVAEARIAFDAGAEAIGLVGPMPSGPGIITEDTAIAIAAAFPGRKTVLLTSETSVEGVCEHVRRVNPVALQLVDKVEPGVVPALRLLHPALELFQVIHIQDDSAVAEAVAASRQVDHILLDSGRPDAGELGGTGRTHNWEISKQIVGAVTVPVWLAGGLTPDNVAQAVAQVRPFGVDLCSGLRPGADRALDAGLLRAFMAAL